MILLGVPQGSILGPTSFAIFIYNLSLVVTNGKCSTFDDDIKLFYEIVSKQDSRDLQLDLEAV